MRRIGCRVALAVDRPETRADLFGPLADLSGVDTGAPAASTPAVGRGSAARLPAGRLVGPPAAISDAALADDPAYRRQTSRHRVASLPLYLARRFEYGVIPIGLLSADDMGNESTLAETSLLIIDTPARAADTAISRAAGLVRLTLEEWPDG